MLLSDLITARWLRENAKPGDLLGEINEQTFIHGVVILICACNCSLVNFVIYLNYKKIFVYDFIVFQLFNLK